MSTPSLPVRELHWQQPLSSYPISHRVISSVVPTVVPPAAMRYHALQQAWPSQVRNYVRAFTLVPLAVGVAAACTS